MRSGKSYFDLTLFKKTVTRWWPIWGSYLVIWFFILPFSLFVDGGVYMYYGDITDSLNIYIWFAALYAPICAMAVLSHLYWPRSANFYGALPVKRQGIFLTQYTAGLCFTIVPNLIIFLLTSLVCAGQGDFNASCMFGWLGVTTVETFFFYSFAILCGMLAGHVLALPVFYGVFNCVVMAFLSLVDWILESIYYGFASLPGWVESVAKWFTPGYQFLSLDWYDANQAMGIPHSMDLPYVFRLERESGLIIAVYCVVAVIMVVAAYFLYKSRRTESAGDVVAVEHLRPVFKYGVAVCSGLFLGYVTDEAVGGLPVWVVVWTVVGYFAAQMILDKSFRVFKKWHGALIVGAVMTAAVLMITLDVTGFEKRVPELDDVESIEVSRFYMSHDDGYDSDSADWGDFILTDKENIEKFIDLHRAIVDGNVGPYSGGSMGYISFNMTYHTSHGTITRTYEVDVHGEAKDEEGSVPWALERIFSDRELYWHIYGFDELEEFMGKGGVPGLRYDYTAYTYDSDDPEMEYDYFRNGGSNYVEITKYADLQDVLDAVKQDFFAGDIGRRTVSAQASVGYPDVAPDNRRTLEITISPSNIREAYNEYRRVITIDIAPTAEKTLSVIHGLLPGLLEEKGLSN